MLLTSAVCHNVKKQAFHQKIIYNKASKVSFWNLFDAFEFDWRGNFLAVLSNQRWHAWEGSESLCSDQSNECSWNLGCGSPLTLKANQQCVGSQHDRFLTLCIYATPVLYGFNLTCTIFNDFRYQDVGEWWINHWLHQSSTSNISCVTHATALRRRKNMWHLHQKMCCLFLHFLFCLFWSKEYLSDYIFFFFIVQP